MPPSTKTLKIQPEVPFDGHQARKNFRLGRRVRDKFALVAVMQREKGFGDDLPAGLRNGNWEFASFKPDGSVAQKDLNACRACHAPLQETNHLFSIEHLVQR